MHSFSFSLSLSRSLARAISLTYLLTWTSFFHHCSPLSCWQTERRQSRGRCAGGWSGRSAIGHARAGGAVGVEDRRARHGRGVQRENIGHNRRSGREVPTGRWVSTSACVMMAGTAAEEEQMRQRGGWVGCGLQWAGDAGRSSGGREQRTAESVTHMPWASVTHTPWARTNFSLFSCQISFWCAIFASPTRARNLSLFRAISHCLSLSTLFYTCPFLSLCLFLFLFLSCCLHLNWTCVSQFISICIWK